MRFGSGEIYTVLERSDFAARIDDSICVGQRRPQDKDERVLLFMKMRAGHKLDQPFEQVIRTAIREALSARHVPAHIFEVKDIPVSPSSLACVPKERLTIGGVLVFWTVYDQREEDRNCG